MNIKTYLEKNTQKSLADKLGVTQGLISQWMLGTTPIPPAQCIKIERVTNGLVTRQELREDWHDIWPTDMPMPTDNRQADRRENDGRRVIN